MVVVVEVVVEVQSNSLDSDREVEDWTMATVGVVDVLLLLGATHKTTTKPHREHSSWRTWLLW